MTAATPALEAKRPVLEAFARVLRLETHNLVKWPELLWQQLYNELQWESQPACTEAPKPPTSRSWLHRTTRLRQSGELKLILSGHASSVRGCAVSPDGSFIVSVGADGAIIVWDSTTGDEMANARASLAMILACAVSPDGSWIVSASEDALRLWDAQTLRERATLPGGPIHACAVSPDGSVLVSAGDDGTLTLWNPASLVQIRTLEGHSDWVRGCAVSPDGAFVVSAGNDRTLKLWDARTGEERASLHGHDGPVYACAVSPDGAVVVSGSSDRTLKLWNTRTGQELGTLVGHSDGVDACAVSPDGSFIVSGSKDRTLKVWDPLTLDDRATLVGHSEGVPTCAVSPDGSFVVSGSRFDGTLRIWDTGAFMVQGAKDVRRGRRRASQTAHRGHGAPIDACAVSPDGSLIVSGSEDRTLKIWDVHTGDERATLVGHREAVAACAVSPNGSFLVSASRDTTLKIWDPAAAMSTHTLQGHSMWATACAVSPDSSFVVSGSLDRSLKIWDARTGEDRVTLEGHREGVNACAVSPDGSFVVSGGMERSLKIWDPLTGDELATLVGHAGSINACAVSPDRSFIVSGSDDESLKIWDPSTGEDITTMRRFAATAIARTDEVVVWRTQGEVRVIDPTGLGHSEQPDSVMACAVSPDGVYVVSVSGHGIVEVWHVQRGTAVARIPLPGGPRSVALHPWQPLAVAGDSTGNLNVVELLGIEYGPLVVTAVKRGRTLEARCPRCQQVFRVGRELLGQEATCPVRCGAPLRVNPFVLTPSGSGSAARFLGLFTKRAGS